MAKVKRFIIGHRKGPALDQKSLSELDSFISRHAEANEVKSTKVGRKVVEMTEEQRQELVQRNPQLIVEEDREIELFGMPGLPPAVRNEGSFVLRVQVRAADSGDPVADATVYAIGEGGAYRGETDSEGVATVETSESTLKRVIVSPRDTYWSLAVPDFEIVPDQTLTVDLTRLQVTGDYGWGHRLMGFEQAGQVWTGRDVKVAVVDSGVSDSIEDLRPQGGLNTLDGGEPSDWNVDEKGHGTHVAGAVACLRNHIGITGGAPDAQVFSVKVFPGGFISDLVEAVEWCIAERMDVINMSLGSAEPSQVLETVLLDAYHRGITCVAAAGNESTAVAFPAAYPTVLAVSAIGRFGTFPDNSAHALKVGKAVDAFGQLFAASFTNFGPTVDVCAPGVAMLSTVPTGYAAWDGTSMACPMVAALATLILQAYPTIRTGDAFQPEMVKAIIKAGCLDLRLPPMLQGSGLPQATRILPAAAPQFSSPFRV